MAVLTLSTALPDTSFRLDVDAIDWRDALRLAGEGLTASGAATPEYTEEMIAAVEEHGPYIVIAPGLALAHSRPSPAVLHTGMSWVRLTHPVDFGSPNDPVRHIIGLAAKDEREHLDVMAALARALSDPVARTELDRAPTPAALRALLDPNSTDTTTSTGLEEE
ncbi:PTS sugar transporter subunit IIA [Actinomyces sp. Z5]|uniref:PTS sugar transporter subunit IIA n=1 Tax=Actinomyces sp. Z5 TaxID=2250216 RepID=UPI0015EC0C15|nr:PTS sugar transporter subunit IIA [Actinomyces sp. Z5]